MQSTKETVLFAYTDYHLLNLMAACVKRRGCLGHDHMVVGFSTTYAISTYHH